MSFYIDDPKTEALANELARIKGISPEEAIRITVIHALRDLDSAEARLRDGKKRSRSNKILDQARTRNIGVAERAPIWA